MCGEIVLQSAWMRGCGLYVCLRACVVGLVGGRWQRALQGDRGSPVTLILRRAGLSGQQVPILLARTQGRHAHLRLTRAACRWEDSV